MFIASPNTVGMAIGIRGKDMLNQNQSITAACPRKGDIGNRVSFRAERLFSIGTTWYFSTREGEDQGPFLSKQYAQKEIKRYIDEMKKKNEFE